MHLPKHGWARTFLVVAIALMITIAPTSCAKARPSASDTLQEELLGRGFDQAVFLYDYANGSGYSFRIRVGNCSGSAEVFNGKLSVYLQGSAGRQTGFTNPTQADMTRYVKSARCNAATSS